jgi:hypothetical protein
MHTLTLLAIAALLGCSTASNRGSSDGARPSSDANRIETIVKADGHYSEQLEQQLTVVINSEEDLARYWAMVYAGYSPVPEPPVVDFSRESIVLVTLGMRGSGGYDVSIDALEEIPEGMRLVITATSPGSNCFVTEALTTPLHIVRTRNLPGVLLFDWRQKVASCE